MLRAQRAGKDDAELALYDRILEMDPAQPEAQTGKQRIWGQRGDVALQVNDAETALEAYKTAGLTR